MEIGDRVIYIGERQRFSPSPGDELEVLAVENSMLILGSLDSMFGWTPETNVQLKNKKEIQ